MPHDVEECTRLVENVLDRFLGFRQDLADIRLAGQRLLDSRENSFIDDFLIFFIDRPALGGRRAQRLKKWREVLIAGLA